MWQSLAFLAVWDKKILGVSWISKQNEMKEDLAASCSFHLLFTIPQNFHVSPQETSCGKPTLSHQVSSKSSIADLLPLAGFGPPALGQRIVSPICLLHIHPEIRSQDWLLQT